MHPNEKNFIHYFRRQLSSFLALTFLCTQNVLIPAVHAELAAIDSKVQRSLPENLQTISLPSELGKIQEIYDANQEPRTNNQEPRTKNQEPGTRN